jgi:GNAT superfamily N-acetyltransferase
MIRKATEADLDRIMDLIVRVVRNMRAEGIDQWNDDYPIRSDFRADILAGELYLDESDEEPRGIRGVVCINQVEPEEYRAASWSREGPAVVIHRLAVNPDFRRRGVAAGFFGLAEDQARRNGCLYLRSDTYSRNAKMNALFVRQGYARAGDIRFKGRVEVFHCYDKSLPPVRTEAVS